VNSIDVSVHDLDPWIHLNLSSTSSIRWIYISTIRRMVDILKRTTASIPHHALYSSTGCT